MRSTLALVLVLLAVALGFLHGASAFKRERDAALADLFGEVEGSGAGSGGASAGGAGAGGTSAGGATGASGGPASAIRRPGPGGATAGGAGAGAGAGTGGGTGTAGGAGASAGTGAAGGAGRSASGGAAVKDRDPTEEEIAAVKALLATAEQKRKAGDYGASREDCAEAARKLLGVRSVVALPLARLAQRGEARAEVLGALAAAVPPNDFASGEGLRKLYLKSGREYVARVLSMAGGQVSFRLANGIEIALPLSELAKPSDPCPKTEWRERCLAGLEERRGKTDDESAFELFRLAAFGLENGLREEAAPILERALEKDRPGLLPEYFCDAERRPSRTTVQLARGGSEAEVAAAVRGAGAGAGASGGAPRPAGGAAAGGGPGAEEEAPAASRPADQKLLADARWRKAMASLDAAIAHYKKSFRGSPDYEKELKAALAGFNEVGGALEGLRADFPESETLDAKIVEVNQARVDCRKRSGAS